MINDSRVISPVTSALLISLLAVSLIFNFIQFTSYRNKKNDLETKMDTIYLEKGKLLDDYSTASAELDEYKGISDSLDKVIAAKQADLEKKEKRIKELQALVKKDATKRKELENEIAGYKSELEQAFDQIDQLVLENTKLKGKNASLTTEVMIVNADKTSLEKKVNTASQLKAEYVNVKAYKKKLAGDGYSETSLARKVNRLEICFTLLDNAIAKPGDRDIYVRFIGPDNTIIADKDNGSGSFNRVGNPEETVYTMNTKVNYKNEKQEDCMTWAGSKTDYKEGTYTAEIYIDNHLASTSRFVLR